MKRLLTIQILVALTVFSFGLTARAWPQPPTTTLPPTPLVQIEGYCLTDQTGQARALFDAAYQQGSGSWTVNGNLYGPFVFGQPALFGVNTWTANPDEGLPISGEFAIDPCGTTNTTTTTVQGSSTTSMNTTTIPAETTTISTPATTATPPAPTPTAPTTLPYTGMNSGLILAGLAALLLGVVAIAIGRKPGRMNDVP